MAKITTERQYDVVMKRIEDLAPLFDDNTPLSDPNVIEYQILSDLIEEYEEEHYPIPMPSRTDSSHWPTTRETAYATAK